MNLLPSISTVRRPGKVKQLPEQNGQWLRNGQQRKTAAQLKKICTFSPTQISFPSKLSIKNENAISRPHSFFMRFGLLPTIDSGRCVGVHA